MTPGQNYLAALTAITFMMVTSMLSAQERKEPADLTKNRAIYQKELAEIDAERDAKVKKLTERYIKVLKKTQGKLTKKNDLDGALAIRKEIEELQTVLNEVKEPEVTMAEDEEEDDGTGRPMLSKSNKSWKGKFYIYNQYGLATLYINGKKVFEIDSQMAAVSKTVRVETNDVILVACDSNGGRHKGSSTYTRIVFVTTNKKDGMDLNADQVIDVTNAEKEPEKLSAKDVIGIDAKSVSLPSVHENANIHWAQTGCPVRPEAQWITSKVNSSRFYLAVIARPELIQQLRK